MGIDTKTGWERSRRTHFDEIVLNYDRARWEYPRQMFDDIFKYSGLGKGKKAVEIGAGTGKATTPVLNAGYDVTAVELGANMANFIQEKHKGYKNFNVIISAFEDVALTEGIYDLAYAASAFHWVDAEIGCPKVFRLLKPGGTFALLRNNVYTADGDALYEDMQAVYEKHYFSYYTSKERLVRHSKKDLMEPSGIKEGFGFEDLSVYGFNDIFLKFYDKTLTYSAEDYVAFMDTMSPNRALKEKFQQKKLDDRLARLDEKISEYLNGFNKEDTLEDEENIPAGLLKLLKREELYLKYKEQLEKTGENEISEADPDARLMGNNRPHRIPK